MTAAWRKMRFINRYFEYKKAASSLITVQLFLLSINPPNATLYQDAKQIDQPHEGDTDEKKDNSDNNANHVLLFQAAANTKHSFFIHVQFVVMG